MNKQQFTNDGVQYEYQEVTLVSVSPVGGPVKGGTVVMLSGSQLYGSENTGLYCMFGVDGVVSATYEGSGLIRCTSPDVSGWKGAGMVALQVMSDDVVYVSTVSFFYEAEASVSSIYPVVGMMSGGTLVTVQGSGFVEGVDVYCKFGGMPSLARWVSSTKLECYSPAASAGYVSAGSSVSSSAISSAGGYVSLEVSMNDQNYSDDNTLFEYQVGAHVEHLSLIHI